MRALATLLTLMIIPIVYGIAQPDNSSQWFGPEFIEWKKSEDEETNITELKELWEEIKNAPTPELIPEPNVYVPGKGFVTDSYLNFITLLRINEMDIYSDKLGNTLYVYRNEKLILERVTDSQFKGTYFLVFNETGHCLNCKDDPQTFSSYKDYNWIGNYTEENYPDFRKIHVKYFIQAELQGYISCVSWNESKVRILLRSGGHPRGGKVISLFEAELFSEANFRKGRGWQLYGYSDYPDGGASYIRGKTVKVSVGLSYYAQYPSLASRSFGRPYVITLHSRFYHQFAIVRE